MTIENNFLFICFPCLLIQTICDKMLLPFLKLLILLFGIGIGSEVSRAVCPDTNQCKQSESGYYCKNQFCPPFCDGYDVMVCGQNGTWETKSIPSLYQVPPGDFHYEQDVYYLYTDYAVNLTPVIDCYDCVYMVSSGSSLPNGLYISTDGIVKGKIDVVLTNFTFSVTAYNEWGSVNCTVSLTANKYSVDSSILCSPSMSIYHIVFEFLSLQFAVTIGLCVLLLFEVTVLFHIKQEKRQLRTVYL